MTASGYDATWWRQFTAAAPELQRAMHAALKARETLELVTRRGDCDESELAAYKQRVVEREQAERRLRGTLRRAQPRPPGSQDIADAAEAGYVNVPTQRRKQGSPSAVGADRFW